MMLIFHAVKIRWKLFFTVVISINFQLAAGEVNHYKDLMNGVVLRLSAFNVSGYIGQFHYNKHFESNLLTL